jgi:2-C-methyl-D-erythritol 4-phosphate cytidylyltransferase
VASKVVAVVTGGTTRTGSVRAAMAEVGSEALVVLVHDAARPLLHDDVIGRVLAPLSEGFDGVVPALPVADTLKRTEAGIVTETVDRSGLVAAQTPQAFEAGALRSALGVDTATTTDCASLVERNGGRIRIVDGDPRLLKVTTRLDLELVERLV